MSRHKHHGFTLLEILIALAIVAIALTAMLQTTSQSVYNSKRLQTTTLSHRILINTANKIQAKLITVPYPPYEHREQVDMAHLHWVVTAKRFKVDADTDKIELAIGFENGPALAQLTLLRQSL